MINLVGKKQLSVKDRKYLETLLVKSKGALTIEEKEHLIARRGYLKQEALDKFNIALKKGDEVNEADGKSDDGDGNSDSNQGDGNDDGVGESGKYDDWKNKDLKKECKKREIEFAGNASNQSLIELLEADDRGELEEVA